MARIKHATVETTELENMASPPSSYSTSWSSSNLTTETQPLTQNPLKTPARTLWRSSIVMYLFLLIGIGGAISHHCVYASVDGKEANGQLKMTRYGTALAYLTKASLVASVLVAYRQQVWSTCARKALPVSAIDSLFAAGNEILGLLNLDIYHKAKVATLLAGIVWLTPLAVILTPTTLAVELATKVNETVCTSVRTFNFNPEATNDWRKGEKMAGLYKLSLSYWNTTSMNDSEPDLLDYFHAPSDELKHTATLAVYLQKVISNDSITHDVCGSGWNCSYTINFLAPGYQCKEQASGRNDGTVKLAEMGAPFDTTSLLPDGNFSYHAHNFLGHYARLQIPSKEGGVPLQAQPYPKNLGAFRTEPVLWIGQSILAPGNSTLPIDSTDPRWYSAFIPKIFSCEHHLTNYTVLFNHTSNQQKTTVLEREFLGRIVNTTYLPGVKVDDGTNDTTSADPVENYVFPQDVERYRMTAAYHSLGSMLRNFLNGTIVLANTKTAIFYTEAITTQLIDLQTYLPVNDLSDRVQGLYEDIILSLLSNPQYLAVAWAGDPSQQSSIGVNTNPEATYPCTKSRTFNHFVYLSWQLWLVYGISIGLALLSVILGTIAIAQNSGIVRDMRFSTIIKASRSQTLGELPWKRGLDRVETEVASAHLRFTFQEDDQSEFDNGTGGYIGFRPVGNEALPVKRLSKAQRVLSMAPLIPVPSP